MVYQEHTRNAWRCALHYQQTYNYVFAKWLDTKLKPLSLNRYEVADIFESANEIHNLKIANVFSQQFFNTTYDLNLSKADLVDLLNVATKGQRFLFNGAPYETD